MRSRDVMVIGVMACLALGGCRRGRRSGAQPDASSQPSSTGRVELAVVPWSPRQLQPSIPITVTDGVLTLDSRVLLRLEHGRVAVRHRGGSGGYVIAPLRPALGKLIARQRLQDAQAKRRWQPTAAVFFAGSVPFRTVAEVSYTAMMAGLTALQFAVRTPAGRRALRPVFPQLRATLGKELKLGLPGKPVPSVTPRPVLPRVSLRLTANGVQLTVTGAAPVTTLVKRSGQGETAVDDLLTINRVLVALQKRYPRLKQLLLSAEPQVPWRRVALVWYAARWRLPASLAVEQLMRHKPEGPLFERVALSAN